jgi:predicted metal-dependent enzyme (double-stranded beta helix superfamily)
MAYDLEQFCVETRATLQSNDALEGKLAHVADKLAALLANPAFVAAAFPDDPPPGQRLLHRDDATDFHVLAHVQRAGKSGMPHSHGTSWAVYGSARGFTDMTEWRRVNPESEPQAVLEPASKYRLAEGGTHFYAPYVIHSTAHPEKAWVIRVTGTDLDYLPRFRFDPRKDRIVENAS